MALSSQIEAAARTRSRPVGLQVFDRQALIENVTDNTDDHADAAQFMRRLGNRHGCIGADCTHPQHDDDIAATNQALILAGLTDDPYPSVERDRKMSPTVKPIPELARAKRLRAAEAKTPQASRPDLSWQDRGACRGEDPRWFFGADNEQRPMREVREEKAREICAACPVRSLCLDAAIERREVGFWGGTNDDERAALRRRRTRRANAA